jgi:hypothetical protein
MAAFFAGSERLESQCRAAGNPICIDYGTERFAFVIGIGWVGATSTEAGMINRV